MVTYTYDFLTVTVSGNSNTPVPESASGSGLEDIEFTFSGAQKIVKRFGEVIEKQIVARTVIYVCNDFQYGMGRMLESSVSNDNYSLAVERI